MASSICIFRLVVMCNVVAHIYGLSCWQCSAKNQEECAKYGKLVTCTSNQDVCATTVRRDYSVSRIFRRCKQKQSCFNDMKQNWNKYGWRHQCNTNLPSSLCQCCCETDSCNLEQVCTGKLSAMSCPRQPKEFENGVYFCTNDNRIGSMCQYRCTKSGFHLNPQGVTSIHCMENGQWSNDPPCCARPCPPYAPFDLVYVLNRHNAIARRMILQSFWWSFSQLWSVDPEFYRASRVLYSSIVHPTTLIHLNQSWASGGSPRKLEPNDGVVNTGNALRFVKDHVFVDDHRDVKHMDVIFVVIDKNSDDDVKEVAKALRDKGVLIYVLFMNYINKPNMQELLDIAGVEEHVFISNGDVEGIGQQIALEMMEHLCQNVCDLSGLSHEH